MDGLEATRMIRQTLSPAEQPAIIALTANAMLEDREQCFGAGMDAHLSKPVRARDLYAALEKLGNVRRYALLGDSSSLSISEYSAGTSSFGTQGSPAAAMTLMEPPLMRPAKFSSSFDRE
jgi:DNA-binding response OmpR family regulator